jgi:vacuolar iron transporter family protein
MKITGYGESCEPLVWFLAFFANGFRFMMDFELKLEEPAVSKAWLEGLVMGVSYFFGKLGRDLVGHNVNIRSHLLINATGGLLPMIPYFAFKNNVNHALFTSIGITAAILIIFGYVKAIATGCQHKDAAWSAVQTLVIGAAAAGVSYGIVKGVDGAKAL